MSRLARILDWFRGKGIFIDFQELCECGHTRGNHRESGGGYESRFCDEDDCHCDYFTSREAKQERAK